MGKIFLKALNILKNQHLKAKKCFYFSKSTERFIGKSGNLSKNINMIWVSALSPPQNHPPKL